MSKRDLSPIFMDYRGDEGRDAATALADRLGAYFGTDRFFVARRTVMLGTRFREALLAAVDSCAAMLVLVGPDWLADRRIDHPPGLGQAGDRAGAGANGAGPGNRRLLRRSQAPVGG